jgi:death on curing protein
MLEVAEARYLSADDVLAIAERYMQALGYASPMLRSNGRHLLESAVHRAQTTAYYGGADLVQQAAALCNGIALNHPFVDGNKRAAFAACLTFLDANNLVLPASALVPLAQRLIDQHELTDRAQADTILTDWLRAHLYPG